VFFPDASPLKPLYASFLSPLLGTYPGHVLLDLITLMSGKVKVKVKCTLVQALRLCTGRTPHRGSRGIALLFHGHGTRRG